MGGGRVTDGMEKGRGLEWRERAYALLEDRPI